MLDTTRQAVCAILRTDPSITPDALKNALRALTGEAQPQTVADAPFDKGLTRSAVAEILGVDVHTVSAYGRKGLIRRICLGATGARATRYSAASVRALLDGRKEREAR